MSFNHFIPVWLSIREAEALRDFAREYAPDAPRFAEFFEEALDAEQPRTLAEMDEERAIRSPRNPWGGERPQHVMPKDDLVPHKHAEDCPCGPTTEPVERDDGSMGWVVIHHSLDGREREE